MDILDFLKDKKDVIKFLLDTVSNNINAANGLRKITESNNEAFKLQKALEVVANQSLQIQRLSILLLIYAQSGTFDSDVAHLMVKMGRGDEAIKQMFKNKIKE